MKRKIDYLVKEKQSRKIFLKRNHAITLPIANKIISPLTNYVKSYSELNELMSNNEYEKVDNAAKYTFVDDWGKHD